MEDNDLIQVPDEYELDDVLTEPAMISIILGSKEKKYWIRPPTDSEKAMCQNAARRKSRELRALLDDPSSEEHELLIAAGMENMSIEEKKLLWLTSNLYQKTFELSRRSMENRDEYFVPQPEGTEEGIIPPTNEEMDKYETDKIKSEKERMEDLSSEQKRLFTGLKAQVEQLTNHDIDNAVQPLMVEQQVSSEWNNQYGLQVLARCTFLDPDLSKRAFLSPEKAQKLLNNKNGQKVLEALLNAHNGLMLDPDLLKN